LSNNSEPLRIQKKTAVIPLVETEDVHLGDNVFPERWGYSHNPLNIAIYPQSAKGLIYFDKENGDFIAVGAYGDAHVFMRLAQSPD